MLEVRSRKMDDENIFNNASDFSGAFFYPQNPQNTSTLKLSNPTRSYFPLSAITPRATALHPKPNNSPSQLWGNRYYRGYWASLLIEIFSKFITFQMMMED